MSERARLVADIIIRIVGMERIRQLHQGEPVALHRNTVRQLVNRHNKYLASIGADWRIGLIDHPPPYAAVAAVDELIWA